MGSLTETLSTVTVLGRRNKQWGKAPQKKRGKVNR